jgi:hypothetical protein
MKQPVQVIMLPTEDRTNICLVGKKLRYIGDNHEGFLGNWQHTYITVSQDIEPIKEGDWYIDDTNTVRQSLTNDKAYWEVRQDYVKIIATTNPKLTIKEYTGVIDESNGVKEYLEHQIPQVPLSFLEEYVANPDGEWEVEYEKKDINPLSKTWEEDYIRFGLKHKPNWIMLPKLNQDNTVNITSVEEKMYSREEVEELCKQCWGQAKLVHSGLFIDWIKENL